MFVKRSIYSELMLELLGLHYLSTYRFKMFRNIYKRAKVKYLC